MPDQYEGLPSLSKAAIAHLKATHPPKCWDPKQETAEDHQAYRGKVELIRDLETAAGLSGRELSDAELAEAAVKAQSEGK